MKDDKRFLLDSRKRIELFALLVSASLKSRKNMLENLQNTVLGLYKNTQVYNELRIKASLEGDDFRYEIFYHKLYLYQLDGGKS